MAGSVHFTPDRDVYIRSHIRLAALCMAGAMAVLWLLGDPNIWTGAIAGLGAITLRGWYLASEELSAGWTLGPEGLRGSRGQSIAASDIAQVRSLGSFVQIITKSGDKHLIKYQADPAATKAEIERHVS